MNNTNTITRIHAGCYEVTNAEGGTFTIYRQDEIEAGNPRWWVHIGIGDELNIWACDSYFTLHEAKFATFNSGDRS